MTARWRAERAFAPAMAEDEREERYTGWKSAVERVLTATTNSSFRP